MHESVCCTKAGEQLRQTHGHTHTHTDTHTHTHTHTGLAALKTRENAGNQSRTDRQTHVHTGLAFYLYADEKSDHSGDTDLWHTCEHLEEADEMSNEEPKFHPDWKVMSKRRVAQNKETLNSCAIGQRRRVMEPDPTVGVACSLTFIIMKDCPV